MGGHGWDGDRSEFSIFRIQISHEHIGRDEGHCRYQRWTVAVVAAGFGCAAVPARSGLRRAPDCGGRRADDPGRPRRGARGGRSAPRPCGDPRAETQQGPTRAPAQPGRLRGGGRGASLGGGGKGRRTSLKRGRRRPGRKPGTSKAATEPEGKKAAAESEPEAGKAGPAPRLRGLLASCSAALALRVSRGGAAARWQRVLGGGRGPPCRRRLGSPRWRSRAAGGSSGRAGTGPRRSASARDCCCEEGRGPGRAGRLEAEVRHPRPSLSPGPVSPALEACGAAAGRPVPPKARPLAELALVYPAPTTPRKRRKCFASRAGSAESIVHHA